MTRSTCDFLAAKLFRSPGKPEPGRQQLQLRDEHGRPAGAALAGAVRLAQLADWRRV